LDIDLFESGNVLFIKLGIF